MVEYDSTPGNRKETTVRKLIAGMKISLDGMFEPVGEDPHWVQSWAEEYGVTPHIDACLLGGGMYAGYEHYWNAIRTNPDEPAWITGAPPTAAEREWADFAARTPHYVLSNNADIAQWSNTTRLGGLDDVASLKSLPGKDIYVVGGAHTTTSLIGAGLLDELRLLVYPILAARGRPLFAGVESMRAITLQSAGQLQDGRLRLVYQFR
jgi:dihydrofolate reductase